MLSLNSFPFFRVIAILTFLIISVNASAQSSDSCLIINEIGIRPCCSTLAQQTREFLELHNTSNTDTIDVQGWFMRTDLNNNIASPNFAQDEIVAWETRFPGTSPFDLVPGVISTTTTKIPPQGYAVIFVSEWNSDPTQLYDIADGTIALTTSIYKYWGANVGGGIPPNGYFNNDGDFVSIHDSDPLGTSIIIDSVAWSGGNQQDFGFSLQMDDDCIFRFFGSAPINPAVSYAVDSDGSILLSNSPGSANFNAILIGMISASTDTICVGDSISFSYNAPTTCTLFSYQWNFDDPASGANNTSTLSNVSHVFNTDGDFTISLIASSGCHTDTLMYSIYVYPAIGSINLGNDTTLCQPNTLVLNANAPGLSVLWSTLETTQTITVGSSGNYSVIVTNGWCVATDSILVTINSPPAVAFTFSNGCVNDPILFVNNSSPGNYLWTFGDGGSSTLNSPQNVYTSVGNFNVQLIVESNGCYDSLTQVVSVSDVPVVGFSATPLEGCAPLKTYFTNTGDSGLVYFWNFNDGFTANFENDFHEFVTPGTYTIDLTVTNSFGCIASATQIDYITVHPSTNASFYASPNFTIINSIVQFTNTSTAETSWSWDFGQGSVSSQENPTMSYTVPGMYLTELIVNNSFGCPDTAYLIIEVRDNPAIYFPNTFTPNNDGNNDVFYVQGVGFQYEFLLEIFDRWGELIFVSHNKNEVWDGLINGNEAMQGTYTWKFHARMSDGFYYEYVGHVNLIK
jgi:gliding motility-associated-like protein